MGRPMSARNQRFACIPREFTACLYAAELNNGIVKVGYSRNPRTRMTSLAAQCVRQFGADILNFHIGPDLRYRRNRAMQAETDLIERLREVAPALPGRKEFFTGVPYLVVVGLIEEISAAA